MLTFTALWLLANSPIYLGTELMMIQGTTFNDFLMYGNELQIVVMAAKGDDIVYSSMCFKDTSETTSTLHGEAGDDLLMGRDGRETIRGGLGDDKLLAESGDDFLVGNNGNDYCHGDDGDDTLYGGNHRDTLVGGSGNDKLFGDGGDDYLNGNSGNDYLKGDIDSDTLIGEDGVDVLVVTNDDLINIKDTDLAEDTILFRTDGQNPESIYATVEGFSAEDYIKLEAVNSGSITSHFTTNNGLGDTLLYISHDRGYLSVIKFNGVEESFVSDKIKVLY